MDNMQDMLGSILSDPEAMSKIRDLGKALGLGGDSSNNTANADIEPPAQKPSDHGIVSNLINSFGSKSDTPLPDENTLGMVSKLMPLLGTFNREDESTALLHALRPFLSGDKQKRLDDASKILRVMRLLPMIKGSGLF